MLHIMASVTDSYWGLACGIGVMLVVLMDYLFDRTNNERGIERCKIKNPLTMGVFT